jgi:hypothetical protein
MEKLQRQQQMARAIRTKSAIKSLDRAIINELKTIKSQVVT